MPRPAASPKVERNGPPRPPPPGPPRPVVEVPVESAVQRKRRDQVLAAAEAIIASEGLPRLSLGRIEQRTGMTRGQLTYYFPTKESILLAVFDRMLVRMLADIVAKAERDGAPAPGSGQAWESLRHGFRDGLSREHVRKDAQLSALIHTFLAQIGHRPDFRQKMAAANAGWRAHLAADIAASVPNPPVPPPVLASVVMALFQGLTDQLLVDPEAFDRDQMAAALLAALAPLFRRTPPGANP